MTRSRTWFGVVIVVLVVGLAGCGGFLGNGGDGATTAPQTDEPTPVTPSDETTAPDDGDDGTTADGPTDEPATDTPASTPTATPPPTTAGTPTPSEEQSFGEELINSHRSGLTEAGSFTGSLEVNYVGEGRRQSEQNVTIRAEASSDPGRRFSSTDFSQGTVSQYQENAGSLENPNTSGFYYERTESQQGTNYMTRDGSIDLSTFLEPGAVSFYDQFEFTDEGVVDTEDGQFHRYTVDGLDQTGEDFGSDIEGEVQDINVVLLVDPETDVVRQLHYEVVAQRDAGRVEVDIEIQIDQVGSTTVDQPDWLDEARQQAGSN